MKHSLSASSGFSPPSAAGEQLPDKLIDEPAESENDTLTGVVA